MSRTLLIDGDTLVFEACAAHEYEAQWDHWLWTLHGDFEAASNHLKDTLEDIIEGLKPDRFVIALSDEERWRPKVMPMYKSNRRKTRKPVTYQVLREWCRETYEVFQRPTLEGDDVLGILATNPSIIKGEKIVVSIDKDMKTIPGLHINYAHARKQEIRWDNLTYISEDDADYFHLYQTLTGDKTDGYPGCPGIGPVNAEKLLTNTSLWGETNADFDVAKAWNIVVSQYAKKGLGEEVALQNARVARICRWTDYDYKAKEVIPWNPPR